MAVVGFRGSREGQGAEMRYDASKARSHREARTTKCLSALKCEKGGGPVVAFRVPGHRQGP